MKTFKELIIKADPTLLTSFVEILQTSTFEKFEYMSVNAINYAKMIGKSTNQVLSFKCPEIKGAIAFIWLIIDNDELKITNITPEKSGRLSIEQYNSILDEFYNYIIKPHINSQYVITVTSDSKTIFDYAGNETAEKLEKWIKSANKSTLNTHTLDFQRWAEFLICAHKCDSQLTTSQLGKYLTEVFNISDEELVNRIVLDYEYGRDLLKEYDKHR